MKKSVLAWILALAMLLPACVTLPMEESASLPLASSGDEVSQSTEENLDSDTASDSIGDSSSNEDSTGGCAGADSEHKDDNDDGKCDNCQENVRVTLDFYAINDLHGKFDDTNAQVGVDELSTYLKQAKSDNPYTFVLSSGDMWQGSPESNITKGALITEWMNEMNFVFMSIGNHEFDWGTDYIENNATLAEFPFLVINVYDKNTNQRADYCQPSVVVEEGDLKIGVIGAIGDCLSSISGDFNKDLDFKTGSELSNLVKVEATRLREVEGVDFVVYSIHADYAEYDASLSNGYVDLVFEGHSHQNYVKTDSYGVYHVQGGGDNQRGISHAEITLNIANGRRSAKAENIATTVYANLADDPIVDTLMTKYEEKISFAYQVLGDNIQQRESTEILNLCAQLYYEEGVKAWGSKYNLFLGGGFMNTRAPYNLQAGTLCYGDLMNVLPFDNQLVLCSIKGRDLKEKFLSGRDRYYVYCGEYGQANMNSIVDNQTYYLVTDTYSSTYSSNNLTEIERYAAKNSIGEYIFARDLLAEYIKTGAWGMNDLTPTSIADILAIGNALADNAATADAYAVWGTITSIENTTYGNMTITDGTNSLYIYGTYDMDGNRYDAMTRKPQVGDRVLLVGKIKKYVNTTYGTTKVEIEKAVLREIQ